MRITTARMPHNVSWRPLPPREARLQVVQAGAERPQRDHHMVVQVCRFLDRAVAVAVGAGGHELGAFLTKLLETQVAIGEETRGVARLSALGPRPSARAARMASRWISASMGGWPKQVWDPV